MFIVDIQFHPSIPHPHQPTGFMLLPSTEQFQTSQTWYRYFSALVKDHSLQAALVHPFIFDWNVQPPTLYLLASFMISFSPAEATIYLKSEHPLTNALPLNVILISVPGSWSNNTQKPEGKIFSLGTLLAMTTEFKYWIQHFQIVSTFLFRFPAFSQFHIIIMDSLFNLPLDWPDPNCSITICFLHQPCHHLLSI